MKRSVTVIDSGICNLGSIACALQRAGADVEITSEPEVLHRADRLILPGVGSFPAAMEALQVRGLVTALRAFVASGRPLLGICLGMQLLLEEGEEFGHTAGLALIPGRVRMFRAGALRIPHMGWNQVGARRPDPLLEGVDGRHFYFVHSYLCQPRDPQDVLAVTEYGETFASVIRRQNVWGVQPHPEKSQRAGLRLLCNFLESCP
ncbi:imidazole glycerol phosphate synthase subunit HisH [bacterium]|nr:MAG: imidazole glycerol phosphate synthase subunit HisH [bacterium]RIK65299.1 MAG: imidazole glycerol phosphate synthase subunit HisH [Planctomycetota bacterium]